MSRKMPQNKFLQLFPHIFLSFGIYDGFSPGRSWQIKRLVSSTTLTAEDIVRKKILAVYGKIGDEKIKNISCGR